MAFTESLGALPPLPIKIFVEFSTIHHWLTLKCGYKDAVVMLRKMLKTHYFTCANGWNGHGGSLFAFAQLKDIQYRCSDLCRSSNLSDMFTVQVSTTGEHNPASHLGTYEKPDAKKSYVEFMFANITWVCAKMLFYDLVFRDDKSSKYMEPNHIMLVICALPCFLHSSTTDCPAALRMAPDTPVKHSMRD